MALASPPKRMRSSLSGVRHSQKRQVSLCETLDRVLNKGAVIAGDVIISVADIDLLYLGLNVVVASRETMRGWGLKEREPVLRQQSAGEGPP